MLMINPGCVTNGQALRPYRDIPNANFSRTVFRGWSFRIEKMATQLGMLYVKYPKVFQLDLLMIVSVSIASEISKMLGLIMDSFGFLGTSYDRFPGVDQHGEVGLKLFPLQGVNIIASHPQTLGSCHGDPGV